MKSSVKVFLWMLVLQSVVLLLAIFHEEINFHWALNKEKELEFEFSNPPKLLGTTDHQAIEEERKAKERLAKLEALVKKKKQVDSLKSKKNQIEVDTSDEAERIKVFNYKRSDSTYALDNFFESLYQVEHKTAKSLIRIAHYGDSQIEGDRISVHLRKFFHKQFGGGGPGFIPIKDILNPPVYSREASDNWTRYTMFHDIYVNSKYGYGGLVFRFSSLNAQDSTPKKADIAVSSNKFGKYQRSMLLFGNVQAPCTVSTTIQGGNYIDKLPIQAGFNLLKHTFSPSNPIVKYEFNTSKSPDVYGICLDDTMGVQLDNFSLRGHGGQGIYKISPEYLAVQYKALNTKLVILQYGGNGIPYVTGEESAKQFEDFFYGLILHVRKANPNMSVLLISAGDMAHKVEGVYQTYKGLPAAVEAQKKACQRAGAAFWNLYEVMGGKGSIIDWVNEKPPLAAADYLHFSEKGCALVGELFYDALMNEYALFKQRKIESKANEMQSNIHKELNVIEKDKKKED